MDLNAVVPLIAGLGALAKVIWELYFSPLARQHIPGPKRAAVSDIWSYWQLLRRRRVMTFHSLFEVRATYCRDAAKECSPTRCSATAQW